MPEPVRVIYLARWLGCPPWDLLERGAEWYDWADICAQASQEAEAEVARRTSAS